MNPNESEPLSASKTIHLISPRGFCAGVERAIDIVDTCLEIYGTPLYVKHEIVHNRFIVEGFEKKGVVFVDELASVPENTTVIFSAHGVAPAVVEEARRRKLQVIDATCPLVTKVHLEAKRFAKDDFTIFLIGHKKHVETIGTAGEAPEKIIIIENVEEARSVEVENPAKVAYLTQTTLSLRDTAEILDVLRARFVNLQGPSKSDICYATTNRQEAVLQVLPMLDYLIVIGAKNSSNSNRLYELAAQHQLPAILIDSASEIQIADVKNVKNIGLTSGASAPEILVQGVLDILKINFPDIRITEHKIKEEMVQFKLPADLIALRS